MEFPIFVSSANFEIKLFNPTSMSFMYIMKRTGPRTEPCGTPLVTGTQFEAVPLMTTLCCLLLSQFFYPGVNISINSKLSNLEHKFTMGNFIKRFLEI